MRKNIFCLFLISFITIGYTEEIPINEIPMYRGASFTQEQKKCNDELIETVVKQAGSRELAAQRAINLAWWYLNEKNDPRTAMKRFNQAWLLEPSNADIFYGYGFLMSNKGKLEDAILYYKKALELNPNYPMALANLARSYKDKAYKLYLTKKITYPDDEIKKILSEALILYERAIAIMEAGNTLRSADSDNDLKYIYYQWAVALEFNGEYAKSWEKIRMSRKYGGNSLIEKGFIEELSRYMPEPSP